MLPTAAPTTSTTRSSSNVLLECSIKRRFAPEVLTAVAPLTLESDRRLLHVVVGGLFLVVSQGLTRLGLRRPRLGGDPLVVSSSAGIRTCQRALCRIAIV